jgi:RND superfamily putative drug exporter
MLTTIARLVSARPKRVLLATLLFAVLAGVVGGPVAGSMKAGSDNFEDPASESVAARQTLERASGSELAPAGQAKVREVARR